MRNNPLVHIGIMQCSLPVEPDGDGRLEYMSPPKRFHTGPSTPDTMLPHPLAHR